MLLLEFWALEKVFFSAGCIGAKAAFSFRCWISISKPLYNEVREEKPVDKRKNVSKLLSILAGKVGVIQWLIGSQIANSRIIHTTIDIEKIMWIIFILEAIFYPLAD
jgi:hypothetical protein